VKYRTDLKSGHKLSVLGFGCMRFPSSMEKTEQLVVKAVAEGINYFDTAYFYSDSESRLGDILATHQLRDKIYLATKLPVISVHKAEDFDHFFNIQLERLRTNYIDYYLMHLLTDMASWQKLIDWGIKEWIAEKKKVGAIHQIGFSFHGKLQEFIKIVDSYDWDFCQIQYNYSDENNQAGVTGLKHASAKGIPVIIMEPLLGGKLVTGLPSKAVAAFNKVDSTISPASWGLRWLYNQPEVTVVLSGMNSVEQLEDNISTASIAEINMLTPQDIAAFAEVKEAFIAVQKIPCTGCNYCMPCPSGVNIPGCFNAYNVSYAMGFKEGVKQYTLSNGLTSSNPSVASQCIRCGKCELHCPQKIEIRNELKQVRKRLEPFWLMKILKISMKIMRK